MFFGNIDFTAVPWSEIAAGLLGLGLLAKGILDGYAKRFSPGPESTCNFSNEDKKKLDDLHDMYGNGGAVDPKDGVPRAFSRDLQWDTLKLLRQIQATCLLCAARLGVNPPNDGGD